MGEKFRVSRERIKNYYKAYRMRFPHKDINSAVNATLNWALGIHRFMRGNEQIVEATKEYKEFIYSLAGC